jgi:hypothetical protein
MCFDEFLKRSGFALVIQNKLADGVFDDEVCLPAFRFSRLSKRPLKIPPTEKDEREDESEHDNRYQQQRPN